MSSNALRRLLLITLLYGSTAEAAPSTLRVLVDTSTEMPFARIVDGELVDGLHRDLGLALATELGRTATFTSLPRRRLASELAGGGSDLLCLYTPQWLPGNFGWTRPFVPIAEVLVSARNTPRPKSIADLAGQPIGSVLGFTHPEVEAALGKRFVRDNAPNAGANLRKFDAGRMQHALFVQLYFDYMAMQGKASRPYHPPLLIGTTQTRCAVSYKGQVSLAEVDAAIQRINEKATVQQLLNRYRHQVVR